MSKDAKSSGGIGFLGMSAVLFIGLKLAKIITWSWWWVLSPLWISTGIALLLIAIILTLSSGGR